MPGEIDVRFVYERHALCFQHAPLDLRSAEPETWSERSVFEYDAMARRGVVAHAGVWVVVQRETDVARCARTPDRLGYLTVGGHASTRDAPHRSIYRFGEFTHIVTPTRRYPARW